MSDEAKASVCSVIWLVSLTVACSKTSIATVLLFISTTVILGLYIAYDAEKERISKRLNRYIGHTQWELKKALKEKRDDDEQV